MKTARWYGILYLSFCLWLLLFPPWVESNRTFLDDDLGGHISSVFHSLGHHWRFSVPLHWQWSDDTQRSSLVPNLAARIDYQQMQYEAVIGLVVLALVFLLLAALETPIRRITACAKVEISLMGTRIRNWRSRDRKRTITGVRK